MYSLLTCFNGCILLEIVRGDFTVVFMSPETVHEWADELETMQSDKNLTVMCMDEVHTVIQW